MAKQTLNNAESGSVIRGKINDNFTECYAKQDALVSGTNLKTVNSTSLLGSGDVAISGSVSDGDKVDIVGNLNVTGDEKVVGGFDQSSGSFKVASTTVDSACGTSFTSGMDGSGSFIFSG